MSDSSDSNGSSAPVRAVASIPLWDYISVVVVLDSNGWRFHGWSRLCDALTHSLPGSEDRNRYFVSEHHAAAYFKDTYAGKLVGL